MDKIYLGIKNDVGVYAIQEYFGGRYIPITKKDMDYVSPDAIIYYDSGIYPGIVDINKYMCDKASNIQK